MTTSAKVMDRARKQAGSPGDGAQRKAPVQKAWTQGTNPITQRSTNQSVPNGTVNAPKSTMPTKAANPGRETDTPHRHAHDRLLFLCGNLLGNLADVKLKNGEAFSGIFAGASLEGSEMRYSLKMVKRTQTAGDHQVNGDGDAAHEYVGVGLEHDMSFDVADVVALNASNITFAKSQAKPQNGVSSGFRTDTDISGSLAMRERELQRWEPSGDTSVDLSLDDSGKGWDQFETNERLYGLQSTYDENDYTTKIDRSQPGFREREARAARLAREIESGSAFNAHVAEERGQMSLDDTGLDEEEKYSGVRRDFPSLASGQPNTYTPPGRRAPSEQEAVTQLPPDDPAIISSQMARPSATSKPADAQQAPSAEAANEPTPSTIVAPEQAKVDKQESSSSAARATNDVSLRGGNVPLKASISSTAAPTAAGKPAKPENATDNVERNLLDSFRQFSAMEKMKISDHQRQKQRNDKMVKLNDLKKFAENFKLHTPVPKDLVPILAKDEDKQQEIIQKAAKNAEEPAAKPAPSQPAAAIADQKSQRSASKPDVGPGSPAAQMGRHSQQRNQRDNYGSLRDGIQHPNVPGQNYNQGSRQQGGLGQRLMMAQQQQHRNQVPPLPQPIPIHNMPMPPTGPSGTASGLASPTSSTSTRLRAGAIEFRPNPAASNFTPNGASSNNSSPRRQSSARPEPRKANADFWGGQKPPHPADRTALDESFNPIKRMKAEVEKDGRVQELAKNGGIPQAYRTPPTWDFPPENEGKSYQDMFAPPPMPVQPVSAPQMPIQNGQQAHQHQLPPQYQQTPPHMSHGHTPQHTPRHPHVQPHHGPEGPQQHFGGHPMQFSHSSSGAHNSPRNPGQFMTYQQQPPQQMPGFQQGMPTYAMSPGMQHAAIRQAMPGQFVAAQGMPMGGHMMQPQQSGSQYIPVPVAHMNPQMQQMYSGSPGHVYQANGPMPGGPQGFANSPRPHGAQLMSHQGSQQGHPQGPQPMIYVPNGPPQLMPMHPNGMPIRAYPQQFAQQYAPSPQQQHPFPAQPHRTPSQGYGQPMMHSHSMQSQGPPPSGPGGHGLMPDGGEAK